MRFEVMRRVNRSPSSARPVSSANTPPFAEIDFFIIESGHSGHKKGRSPRAAPHFTSIYRIPNRTPQMGHASQLSFSPRILCLQEIPNPSPLDRQLWMEDGVSSAKPKIPQQYKRDPDRSLRLPWEGTASAVPPEHKKEAASAA